MLTSTAAAEVSVEVLGDCGKGSGAEACLIDEWMERVDREALPALGQQREVDAGTPASKSEASAIHLIARLVGKGG